MRNKNLSLKWNSMINNNKKKWAQELCEHLSDDKYWDISFEKYTKYKVFSTEFASHIYKLHQVLSKEDPFITIDDVSHDLFLFVCNSTDEEFENSIDEIIDTIIDSKVIGLG